MTPQRYRLSVDETPAMVVVRAGGELERTGVAGFAAAVRDHAADRPVVIDLDDVEYLDSAAVQMFDDLRRSTELRLVVRPDGIVRRTLHVAGVDRLIAVFDTLDAATRADSRASAGDGDACRS